MLGRRVFVAGLLFSALGWSGTALAQHDTLFRPTVTERSTGATLASRPSQFGAITTQDFGQTVPVGGYSHGYNANTYARALPTGPAPGTNPINYYQAENSGKETWVRLIPYAWLPEIQGEITAFGVTQSVDISISDLFDAIKDGDLRGAAQGHVEVGKGRWGFIFDGMIVSLAPSKDLRFAQVDFLAEQTMLEALGIYTLTELRSGNGQADSATLALDLLGGGRYYSFKNAVDIDGKGPLGIEAGVEQSVNWVDLVIGGRVRMELAGVVAAWVRADYGGFNLGTSSDRAWGLSAGFQVHCSPGASFIYGYRILDIEESQGEGRRAFGFDAQMRGPFVALNFSF